MYYKYFQENRYMVLTGDIHCYILFIVKKKERIKKVSE